MIAYFYIAAVLLNYRGVQRRSFKLLAVLLLLRFAMAILDLAIIIPEIVGAYDSIGIHDQYPYVYKAFSFTILIKTLILIAEYYVFYRIFIKAQEMKTEIIDIT